MIGSIKFCEHTQIPTNPPTLPSSSDKRLREVLIRLNDAFASQEKVKPAAGYRVTIVTKPSLAAILIPEGERKEGPLSGLPQNISNYVLNCPFCKSSGSKPNPSLLNTFEDESYALRSLSNQVLVIPKEHYPHWFTIPLETQAQLLRHILQIREDNPSQVQKPIEFHCGSAGGQTVFHFHGRTGVYLKVEGI